jgi:small-conductance mechanosensitive channel
MLNSAMLAAVMSDSAVHGQVVHGWAKFRRDARAFMDVLDDYGFDIGHYHISVFNAAKMVLVVVAMFMIARLGSRIARHLFSRMTSLDSAQQVLGEKLVSLAVWVFAFLLGIDLLGISLTALTVFSGAFGLAIGFGLQKTFGNLIAGNHPADGPLDQAG